MPFSHFQTGTAQDQGFSLLELMIVTVVLATISVAATVSLRSGTDQTPVRVISNLKRAIDAAQTDAFFTG
ncbi:MAG: prepilin-type N-terminal cleavage/methylation domain-containing protein, partial [Pseudomonadota bacterium]